MADPTLKSFRSASYREMDSGRSGTGGPCSNCCECLVPVRCVIDQHEVEIIPASARSSTSNEFTARGGSSLDSTSRTAYGNSSYRMQQRQQLSQRAAALGSTRNALFYQGNSFLQQARDDISYRSAAPADIFSEASNQVSWDSKAPRVPLINLRKIQHHGSSLPSSPLDSERLSAVQESNYPRKKERGSRGEAGCFDYDETLSDHSDALDVLSGPQQDSECRSESHTSSDSDGGQSVLVHGRTSEDRKQGGGNNRNTKRTGNCEGKGGIDGDATGNARICLCSRLVGPLTSSPGDWKSNHKGKFPGKPSDMNPHKSHLRYSSVGNFGDYQAQCFPMF